MAHRHRRLAAAAPGTFRATRNIEVDLDDASSEATAIAWWEQLTSAGGEGMVIKPIDVVAQWKRGVVQPGIKCRGPEYLRIIYGAEYLARTALPPARAGSRPQAQPRRPRILPRHRSPRTLRAKRAAPPSERMRLRCARSGVRTSRSAALIGQGRQPYDATANRSARQTQSRADLRPTAYTFEGQSVNDRSAVAVTYSFLGPDPLALIHR